MKLQGIIEADMGIFFAHIHFGQRDGRDFAQISFPQLGDMNENLEYVKIWDASLDLVLDVNGFPMEISLKEFQGDWSGKATVKSISYENEFIGKKISNEPNFQEKHYIIPAQNIETINNSYENDFCDFVFNYELGNQQVLAYLKEIGIETVNGHDYATAKTLMAQLSQQIHQDGVNCCHDREHCGTIAQIQFAYQQDNKTNCRGMAIILCGILRAYGFKANYVECWPVPEDHSDMHVVCEVYCEDLKKTVMLDPSSNLVYFLDGIPLSLMELKQALCDGRSRDIRVNEDAQRSNECVNIMQMLGYMSKNLIVLCKCVDSSEEKEMIGENCICLLPVGVTDNRQDELAIKINNVRMFYT